MKAADETLPMGLTIEPLSDDLRSWVRERTQELFGGDFVVTRGVMHTPALLSGFVARDGANLAGLITFQISAQQCEIVTLDALIQHPGIGTRLIKFAENEAHQAGCQKIWLITTNDNLDALRFYQRRGYTIAKVHANAIAQSRKLKPTIPLIGNYGIPLTDEIELQKILS